jgi:hypothetical protein
MLRRCFQGMALPQALLAETRTLMIIDLSGRILEPLMLNRALVSDMGRQSAESTLCLLQAFGDVGWSQCKVARIPP